MLTADLHQHIPKWKQLVAAVERDEPRFVLIAGDLLPKSGGFKGQRDFFPKLALHLEDMRKTGATVLLMMGNDDFHPLEPKLDELATQGLCVNMNGRVHREKVSVPAIVECRLDARRSCGQDRSRGAPTPPFITTTPSR